MPTTKKMRLVARSTAGFCHTPPPSVLYGIAGLGELVLLGLDIAFHVAAGGVLLRPDPDRILRDGVERPQQLAVLGVVRLHESADAVFAAVGADEHFALDDGRSHRLAVAELGIGDIGLPHLVAGLGVERDQLGVEGGEIDLVLGDRDAAIVRPAAIGRDRSERLLVVPQLLAGLRVERVDLAERGRDIHHAVDDDGRGLHQFLDLGLEDPGRAQAADVGGVDLRGGVIALLRVVAVGVQEVVAVAGGAIEHVLGDIAGREAGPRGRPRLLLHLLGRREIHAAGCKRARARDRQCRSDWAHGLPPRWTVVSPCSNRNGQIFPLSLPNVIPPPEAVKADGGQGSGEEVKTRSPVRDPRPTGAGHAGERRGGPFAPAVRSRRRGFENSA